MLSLSSKRATSAILALGLLGGGMAYGYHTGKSDSSSIPECVHADYNDGSQKVCYTVNYSTGTVIVIDKHDEVVS